MDLPGEKREKSKDRNKRENEAIAILPCLILPWLFYLIIYLYLIFKGYFPFTVIIKHWLYSLCYTLHPWAYLIANNLYLPFPHPYIALPPLPTGKH